MGPAKSRLSIETALAFIMFCVPLVFSTSSYNFIYIKELIFSAGAAAVLGRFVMSRTRSVSMLSLLPLGFFAWMMVVSFCGKHAFAALPAIIRYAALFIVYFCLANSGNVDKPFITRMTAMSAVIPVTAGILQAFKPGFMSGFMVFGGRVPSFFGNPNFFGAYIAGVMPVIVTAALGEKGRMRWFYYILALLAFVCAMLTGSKAAYVGLIIEGFAGLYLLLKNIPKTHARSGVMTVAVALLCSLAVPAFFGVAYPDAFKPSAYMKNDSVFFRYYTWKGTLSMIAARPITGSGAGTFYLDYPVYKPAEIMKWSGEHSYEITQPENILLQAAAETGLAGLLILLASIWAVAAAYKRENLHLYIGLVGLLAVNLFGVDANYMPSAMLFFVFAGLAVNGAGKKYEIGEPASYVSAAVAAVILIAGMVMQSLYHVSDIYLKRAIDMSRPGGWAQAIELYNSALKANKYNITAAYFKASAIKDAAMPGWQEESLKEFDAVEKLAPDYVLLHYKKAEILRDAGRMDEAVAEYEKMLRTDPYLKPALSDLAFIYYNKGEPAKAAACLEKALEKYPADASIYNNLGNIYFMEKEPEKSVLAYKKAVEINPNKDYYYNLGCVYLTLKDTENAKKCMIEASKLDTQNDPKIARMRRILGNK